MRGGGGCRKGVFLIRSSLRMRGKHNHAIEPERQLVIFREQVRCDRLSPS